MEGSDGLIAELEKIIGAELNGAQREMVGAAAASLAASALRHAGDVLQHVGMVSTSLMGSAALYANHVQAAAMIRAQERASDGESWKNGYQE